MPSCPASSRPNSVSFQAVVRAGGIAERGPDAAEPLGVQLLDRLVGVWFVPVAPGLEVDVLGERLGEPVGQSLDHDRLVVVATVLVPAGKLVRTVDGHGESAEVVPGRGDEIGEAPVGPARRLGGLLAQHRQPDVARPARRLTPADGRLSSRSARARSRRRRRAWRWRSSMIWSSRVLASSKSSRAAGWPRIAGYLPFSSQARKKNCQSIISRSAARSGCTVRSPVNAGPGRSSNGTRSRLARAAASVSSGTPLGLLVLLAQPLLVGPVGCRPGLGPGRR